MSRFALIALTVALSTSAAFAGPLRDRISARRSPTPTTAYAPPTSVQAGPQAVGEAVDALDQVNAQRAARGLRPFLRDDNLLVGAMGAAAQRAKLRVAGHLRGGMGDFAYLPPGTWAHAGGAGAWLPGEGFGACCVYENWNYAGAATVKGSDGLLYHQIFVRR